MKTFGKVFLWICAALLLLWMFPRIVRLAALKPYSTPFTLYSPVIDGFVWRADTENDFALEDEQGNIVLGKDSDTLLPLFYYTDLAMRGQLPSEIKGKEINVDIIQKNRVIEMSRPGDVNKPGRPVYMLMESVPEREGELDDPEYAIVCRKDGFHLYKMADNKEDTALSEAFATSTAGFAHPVKLAACNPSHHKSYDEGYLMTDSNDVLWHIKLANGAPVVENFGSHPGIRHMMVTENDNHQTLGFIFSDDDALGMLLPDGSIVPTEVKCNPLKQSFMVVGDVVNYTVKVSDNDGEKYYALNTDDFSLIDTLERSYPDERSFWDYITPLRLIFSTSSDSYIFPRFRTL